VFSSTEIKTYSFNIFTEHRNLDVTDIFSARPASTLGYGLMELMYAIMTSGQSSNGVGKQ